ncbi:MAG: type II secretion system protein [Candidatus Nitronauta litoralis]|uniref:Type II secretion system protein n=1 Tax=Candidatus Nitronauta litoralis TaxID=2705533 RepID=A0A7T0G0H8_9BACT|nr:MAG: type II secretion system protein [Candidatus Nitronauta litoralis]
MMTTPEHPGGIITKRQNVFSSKGAISQAGFTLLEIIVSILLIGIIGVVTLSFLTNLIQTNQDASGQLEVVEDVNTALDFMARELRQVDEFSWPIRCGNPAVSCVPGTVYTRILFSKDVEMPLDPARRDTNTDDIIYNLNGTTLERISNGITTTLATNVNSFSIRETPLPLDPGTPNGLFEITLQVTRPSLDPGTSYDFTGVTAAQIRNRWPLMSVAFVVNNPGNLHAQREVGYNNHLANVLGHNVSLFNDNDQTWTPTNFDVVVLSGSGGASADSWLSGISVPILTLYAQDYNEFSLGTNRDTNGQEVLGTVQIANHFITRVFGLGNFAFDDGVAINQPDRGYITGFSNQVTSLISYAIAGRSKLLVVQSGGTLVNGSPAPARRAFLGMRHYTEGGRVLNRNGLKLFNRTLAWAAGLD